MANKKDEKIILRTTAELKEAAQKQAAKEGRSLSNYIEWLIRKDLEK